MANRHEVDIDSVEPNIELRGAISPHWRISELERSNLVLDQCLGGLTDSFGR